MNKRQNIHHNTKKREKNYRLWIVAFIFFQVACSTTLNKKDQETLVGSYLEINFKQIESSEIVIGRNNKLQIGMYFEFNIEKYTDIQHFKELKNSLDLKYYLKNDSAETLVVMNDDSLRVYKDGDSQLDSVYYKIKTSAKVNEFTISEIKERKPGSDVTMCDCFCKQEFENMTKQVDDFFEEYYQKSPISTPKVKPTSTTTSNLQQKLLIIACSMILIIVVTILCIQCCRNQNEPDTENIPHDQHETNDLSNNYPSSTDLVIDIKETEYMRSMQVNINQSDSITAGSMNNTESNSTNLFTIKASESAVQESKSAESIETNFDEVISITTVSTVDIKENRINCDPPKSTDLESKKPKTAQFKSKKRENTHHVQSKNDEENTDDTT